MALILDTGPVLAALNQRDPDHARCRRLIEESSESLIIPGPTLVELDYFIHERMDPRVMLTLLDDIRAGAYVVENVQPSDYARIAEILERYVDADIGFVDAAVLAIVERLREPKLATLDQRHFRILKPRHIDSLELLPE